MALPAGISTATVTVGVPVTFSGLPVRTNITITPSAFLVHTATGHPLVNMIEEASASDGVAVQFTLPVTDQDGFQDEAGNAYKNWYYTATIQYVTDKATKAPFTKVFQLATGQSIVDLDLLPSGSPAMPYTAPIAGVTSVNGNTGAVVVPATTDSDVAGFVQGSGPTATALNATYALKADLANVGGGDKSHTITDPTLAKAPRAVLQTIPTYDGSGIVVHPSVYFNPDGWNGWKYWMAMTPYPSSNVDLENASIVVSQDGNTWQVPAGLTNPVVPPYPVSGSGYNSDPYLTVDGATMYLFWRANDSLDRHWYKTSTDGVNWSAKVQVRGDDPTVRRLVAPSYVKDASGWTMYAVDIIPNPRKIVRAKAATLAGLTTATVENVTVTGNTGNPWHLDAHKVGGEWHLMVQDGGSGGGDLWAAVSNDGLNFTAGPAFIAKTSGAWDAAYYKSCFVPAVNGGLAGWDAWIGSASFTASGNIVGRTFVRFDQLGTDLAATNAQLALARGETAVLQSLNGLPPWIIGESFARADNATSLGSANTGQAWTAVSGSWKIANKAAQPQAAANNIATIETGAADHWVNVTYDYADATGTRALITRYADASNFYRFGVLGGVLKLQKVVAGAAADVGGAVTGTIASGMTLGVRCIGSTIELYVNNVLAATRTDSALATGTKVGIQDNSATGRYRMFTARTS